MDRAELLEAKRMLLSQLLKIPDGEKTTSDVELESALMNDWAVCLDAHPCSKWRGAVLGTGRKRL